MPATAVRLVRLGAGLVVAPVAPGLLSFCVSVFGHPGETLRAVKLCALVGYPAMLVLGIPGYVLLRRRGWTRAWHYCWAGMLIGLIVAAVLFGPVWWHSLVPGPGTSLKPSAAILTVAAMLGGFAGLVFWMIARPDRDSG